jgi:O-antigen ligase
VEVIDEGAAPPSVPPVVFIPDRITLWRVGVQAFRMHPWTGIGLNNFRLIYGRFLGLQEWNATVHSNNLYLEILVSLGLAGALPFFAWLGALVGDIRRTLARTGPDWLSLSLGTALLAYLAHGLLDYFLLFHATGLLFWLLVGLWIAFRGGGEPSPA